jgi:hypothetical protein
MNQVSNEEMQVSKGLWLLGNNTSRAQARAMLVKLAHRHGINKAYIDLASGYNLPIDQDAVRKSPYLSRMMAWRAR